MTQEKFDSMCDSIDKTHNTINYDHSIHDDWSKYTKYHKVNDVLKYYENMLDYIKLTDNIWLLDVGLSDNKRNIFVVSFDCDILEFLSCDIDLDNYIDTSLEEIKTLVGCKTEPIKVLKPLTCVGVDKLINTIYYIVEQELIEHDKYYCKIKSNNCGSFNNILYEYFKTIKGSIATTTQLYGDMQIKRHENDMVNDGYLYSNKLLSRNDAYKPKE